MKILIVSNLYPPHYHGGYEVRCAQVAEALSHSGHEVCVLTSAYGLPLGPLGNIQPRTEQMNGVRVQRWLNQYLWKQLPDRRPWTLFQAKRELQDARTFLDLLTSFQPDIVNWWSMYGLSKTLLPIPHFRGIPDVHWIEHWWMIEEYGSAGEKAAASWAPLWDGKWGPHLLHPLLRLVGRTWERQTQREGIPTRDFPNSPSHVCFVSEYMRRLHHEVGIKFASEEIIYGGVPASSFYEPIDSHRHVSAVLRALYAGQISSDRGLHTAVQAIGRLDPAIRSALTLTIAGEGPSAYLEDVKAQVEALGITRQVVFLGKVPHEQMPATYKRHDVLIFPSTRSEGLPLTMVEAMLAGCAVVTTGSGGAAEIAALADLPMFSPHDSAGLSVHLAHLVTDRVKVSQIASRGQEVALRDFNFDRMMERWLATLAKLYQERAKSRVPTLAPASHRGKSLQPR